MRSAVLIATGALLFTFTGCTPDERVYFQNDTDQALYIYPREPSAGVKPRRAIEPNQTTPVQLVGYGDCSTFYVITDKDGNLVKDPGEMCWHDTVTIP